MEEHFLSRDSFNSVQAKALPETIIYPIVLIVFFVKTIPEFQDFSFSQKTRVEILIMQSLASLKTA